MLGPFIDEGDILGHEPMGIVEEVGADVTNLAPGDRVVVPFNISCGHCFMCEQGLQSQCETTQVREQGMRRGALRLHEALRRRCRAARPSTSASRRRSTAPIKVPEGPPDDRFVFLSDVLPTAWQAVEYADVPDGGHASPCSGSARSATWPARIALHRGARASSASTSCPSASSCAARSGVEVLDLREHDDDLGEVIRELTDGRGTDSVIDAVGMEAHGSPVAKAAQTLAGAAARLGRREADGEGRASTAWPPCYLAIDIVRRGGTISLIGVYGGMADPLPMLTLFDKQIQLRMGQANVKRWVDDIMPLLMDGDPLGVENFASHVLPLDKGPEAYEKFQKKEDGFVKVLLKP